MSGKELLAGMSYVEERFVDEAENQTIKRGHAGPWIKLLPVAACLCIMLVGVIRFWNMHPFSAGNTESFSDNQESVMDIGQSYGGEESEHEKPVGGDPQSWLYQAQYIRTDGSKEDAQYPLLVVIRSRTELEQYYHDNKDLYDLERREKVYSDSTIGFLDACDQYDDAFFAGKDLIILVLEESSGSIRHEIQGIRPYQNDSWQLTGRRITPEECTDDMAQWHILIEIEKNLIAEDEEIVLEMTD